MEYSRSERSETAVIPKKNSRNNTTIPTIQSRVIISGKVQGVGFRAATLQQAKQYPQILGFVTNLPDGRVEALFAGNGADVLSMVAWCQKGPSSAQVTHLEVKEEQLDFSLKPFHIQS